MRALIAAIALVALAACGPQAGGGYNVEEKSIAQLQAEISLNTDIDATAFVLNGKPFVKGA